MSTAAPPPKVAEDAHEASLMAALQAGSDAAYEQVLRLYGPRLLIVARQIVGTEDDAHDALQDAFLTAFKAIGRFEGKSKLSTGWTSTSRFVPSASIICGTSRRPFA